MSDQDLSAEIDMDIFSQILEMDDDAEEKDFSKSLVVNYFEQAEETISMLEKALQNKDIIELGNLGHFLKGSSAALGVFKVREHCEKIQLVAKGEIEYRLFDVDEKILQINEAVKATKDDYGLAEKVLKKYYNIEV